MSRKEFIRRGIASFGKDLLQAARYGDVAGGLAGEVACHGRMVLDNSRCLAQRGGCFACLDRCPREALSISPGVGIRVNEEECDGCGECGGACPLDPPALGEYHPLAGSQPEEKGE